MRTTLLFATAFAAATPALTTAQSTFRPQPSGRGIAEVVLAPPAGTQATTPNPVIRVDYGQPHLRGRVMFTDSLVPYDRAWRTGANALTTLRTDLDLAIGGVNVAKGTYVVFTLPARAGWTLILQRNENQSATEYTTERDVARIPLRHATLAAPMESLTFWLIPSTASGVGRGELRLAWGREQLSADWVVR
ncbi:MAG TPA: DUF2911 domain-containing protein [Gemmatimonadaceae bacterium]|nr:DUF2911 domain-containing protein [Gemmatimonadaceae bacterium]